MLEAFAILQRVFNDLISKARRNSLLQAFVSLNNNSVTDSTKLHEKLLDLSSVIAWKIVKQCRKIYGASCSELSYQRSGKARRLFRGIKNRFWTALSWFERWATPLSSIEASFSSFRQSFVSYFPSMKLHIVTVERPTLFLLLARHENSVISFK